MTDEAYRTGWERIFGDLSSKEPEDIMYNVEKLIQTKTFQNLPPGIKLHKVFDHIKRIKRVFPYIGLKNCLEPCEELFQGKKTSIGFSSGGITGLWDIATMSMRGVCSCMHWNNLHSRHLIGSVTDPFLGIVYITDNEKTPYGISFRRRALVRFVHNPEFKDFRLILERPYLDTGNKDPSLYENKDPYGRQTLDVFKKFLTSKVDPKYVVKTHQERHYGTYGYSEYIPTPTSINHIGNGERSMSDCSMPYQNLSNDKFIAEFANQDE